MVVKESWNVLIVNELINYSFFFFVGLALVIVGFELFRELDIKDVFYGVNYVEINYFFR